MDYKSPEADAYPAKYKRSGNWVGCIIKPRVIAYNTKLVSAGEAPSTYEDLLNPKWKGGKIGMAENEYEWFSAAKQFWGDEKATKYLKNLAKQTILICNSSVINLKKS